MSSVLGRALVIAIAVIGSSISSHAQERVFTEDFRTDPLARGWEIFGPAGLFQWNPTEQNLRVTWDSARSNAFFALPIGRLLTRKDDFSASLDLTLLDIAAGTTQGKPGAMQLAFGFHNESDAQKTNFIRGTGTDSPNLVEFNFFPDTGFGATVLPAALSTNSGINYNGPQDFGFYELPIGVVMRITLDYSARQETISVAVRTNGVLVGPVTSAKLSTNSSAFSQPFTDFAVDAFAIPSYSEFGQSGEFAGSLRAHGIIDNIEVRVPPLPVRDLQLRASPTGVTVSFASLTGWRYGLESTTDFRVWTRVGDELDGTGERVSIAAPANPGEHHRFYRVAARRTN